MSTTCTVELTATSRPVTDRSEQDNVNHRRCHENSDEDGNRPDLVIEGSGDDEAMVPPAGRAEFSLPAADTGKDAWLFLAACFVTEALVWGFPFAFGIFQDYYRTHEPFAGSSHIAIIGTCAMGIMYLDIPITLALQRLYPKPFLFAPAAGLLTMCAALALSSLSTSVTHLILTQGILYAVGGSICYCPCIVYMDQWFVRRKGFAYGVMWSGTGLGGITIPLLLEFLLGRYGFRATLRIWAVALFALTAPLVYFIKPRVPPPSAAAAAAAAAGTRRHRVKSVLNLGFVLRRPFALYQLANVVEGAGYFLPGIFLPAYASAALGAGDAASALTLLVLNLGAVVGCVAMGALIDRLHVTTCILISTLGASAGVFLLWGLGGGFASLYLFCLVYGLFAGAYTSTWPGVMKHVMASEGESGGGSGSCSSYDPLMLMAFLAVGRGVGNMVSGPLSEALLKGSPWQGQAFGGFGSGYGTLIAFTGSTAVIGGASFVFRRVGWL